jgi:hypothetical protein
VTSNTQERRNGDETGSYSYLRGAEHQRQTDLTPSVRTFARCDGPLVHLIEQQIAPV